MRTENQEHLKRDTIPKPFGLGSRVPREYRLVQLLFDDCSKSVQITFNSRRKEILAVWNNV